MHKGFRRSDSSRLCKGHFIAWHLVCIAHRIENHKDDGGVFELLVRATREVGVGATRGQVDM